VVPSQYVPINVPELGQGVAVGVGVGVGGIYPQVSSLYAKTSV
jgi:hypothetical protein